MLYTVYPLKNFKQVQFEVQSINFIDPNDIFIDTDTAEDEEYKTKYYVCIKNDREPTKNGYMKQKSYYISFMIAVYRIGMFIKLLKEKFGDKEYYILPEDLVDYYDKIFTLPVNMQGSVPVNIFLNKLNNLTSNFDHTCKTINYYLETKCFLERDLMHCIKYNPSYKEQLLDNMILPAGIELRKEMFE